MDIPTSWVRCCASFSIILDVLEHSYKASMKRRKALTDWDPVIVFGEDNSHEEISLQFECICCLQRLMDMSQGLDSVMSSKEGVALLVMGLLSPSIEIRCRLLAILSCVALYNSKTHKKLLSAFEEVRDAVQFKHRHDILMTGLSETVTLLTDEFNPVTRLYLGSDNEEVYSKRRKAIKDYWIYTFSCINAIVNTSDDIRTRAQLREEFTQIGIEAYIDIGRVTGDSDILTQINVFTEEKGMDCSRSLGLF